MNRRQSIKIRLYLFLGITIFIIALATSIVTYLAISIKTDNIYKNATIENANKFALDIDAEFMKKYKKIIQSDEYQQLRELAEEQEDEQLIKDYFIKKDIWNEFFYIRNEIDEYLANIKTIKYLYLVDYGGLDATYDMYLIDDSESAPLYEIGYYEERESEFYDKDISNLEEPVISNGDWGWLCSFYAKVKDSNGETVCLVGCDIDMNNTYRERHMFILSFIILIIILSTIIYMGAIKFTNKLIIKPLKQISEETRKFDPTSEFIEDTVINLDVKNNEIGDIYYDIQSMQTNIISYINDLHELNKDKLKLEQDNKEKDEQITKISAKTYKDALTGVGNNAAYDKKAKELAGKYAIVMVDINNLKQINDLYGHKTGDEYIKGCCRMICNAYKHSPVYRIGGDEFIVILQGIDYDNRKTILTNLTIEFDSTFNNHENSLKDRYSASIGMADNRPDDLVDAVFKRADKAMYDNKMKFREKYGSYR